MSVGMDRSGSKNGQNVLLRQISAISSTDTYSEKFKFTEECYANQMKPLLNVMKYTGMFPITISKSGKLQATAVIQYWACRKNVTQF
jgi:hypothetical protein